MLSAVDSWWGSVLSAVDGWWGSVLSAVDSWWGRVLSAVDSWRSVLVLMCKKSVNFFSLKRHIILKRWLNIEISLTVSFNVKCYSIYRFFSFHQICKTMSSSYINSSYILLQNPYKPHPRPSLCHLNSCAVDPPFCRLSLLKSSFNPCAPSL